MSRIWKWRARPGVKAAAGEDVQAEVYLEQVEWLSPVVVGPEGLDLHVELFAEDDGRTSYEIYSIGNAEERAVHSQGRMVADPVDQALEEMPAGTLLAEQPSRAVEVAGVTAPDEQSRSRPGPDPHLLVEKTLHRLKALLVDLTRLKVEQIDAAAEPLESYGINSVMIMARFNRRLGKVFDGRDVEDAVLRVSDAFGRGGVSGNNVRIRLRQMDGTGRAPAADVSPRPDRPTVHGHPRKPNAGRRAGGSSSGRGEACDPIAIIGMSGRYSGCAKLWTNIGRT